MLFSRQTLSLCFGLLVLTSAPAIASPARIIAETPFRDGPAADYRQIGSLDQGTRVDVLWCGTRDNYCLIDRHGKRGWVPANVLMAIAAAAEQHGSGENSGKASSTPGPAPDPQGDKKAIATLEKETPPTTLTITTVKPLTFTKQP